MKKFKATVSLSYDLQGVDYALIEFSDGTIITKEVINNNGKKITVEKSNDRYDYTELDTGCRHGYKKEWLKDIRPYEEDKIVDLSGLLGNKEILFEFKNTNCEHWVEGYLMNTIDVDRFRLSIKHSNGFHWYGNYQQIRFQTDRWYPWFGGKLCPLPDGVDYEVKTCDMNGGIRTKEIAASKEWEWRLGFRRVIHYRITGIKDGYRMPGK